MPSIYTHYRFGEEVLPRLSKQERDLIEDHRRSFDFGLQGPDFLFFDQLRRIKTASFGHELHLAPFAQSLQVILPAVSTDSDKAYLYGLIGHFALDSVCHPLIDKAVEEEGMDHMAIETDWDKRKLLEAGFVPREYPLEKTIALDEDLVASIERRYGAFGVLSREELSKAPQAMVQMKRLLRTPGGVKNAIIVAGMKLSGHWKKFRHVLILDNDPEAQYDALIEELEDRYEEAKDTFEDLLDDVWRLEREGVQSQRLRQRFG